MPIREKIVRRVNGKVDKYHQLDYRDEVGKWRNKSFKTRRLAADFERNVALINRIRHDARTLGISVAEAADLYLQTDRSSSRAQLRQLLNIATPREEKGETVQAVVDRYLEDRGSTAHGRSPLKKSTLSTYETRLKLFTDRFGSKGIREITRADIKQYRDWLMGHCANGQAAQNCLTTVSVFFKYVRVDLELRHDNPVDGISVEIRTSATKEAVLENDIYSDTEVARLFQVATAEAHCPKLSYSKTRCRDRAILALLTFCGLRIGEALALEWSDFDLEKRTIFVERNQDRKNRITSIKTKAGMRLVNIPKVAMVYLTAWKKLSPDRFNAAGREGRATYRNFHRTCKHWIAKAGLKDRSMHSLRHYFVSKLIEDPTIPESEITRLIGHTDIAFTRRVYGHLLNKSRRSEATGAILDGVFAQRPHLSRPAVRRARKGDRQPNPKYPRGILSDVRSA